MKQKLLVCENFFEEVSATFHRGADEDMELCSYACLCESKSKRDASIIQLRKMCEKDCRTIILAGENCRLKEVLGDLPTVSIQEHNHCYFCSASDWMLQYVKDHGGFLIGRAWLDAWEHHLSDAGYDQISARMHYRQYYQEIICLGNKKDTQLIQSLDALSKYLDLPGRILELDQDYLDLMVGSAIHELRVDGDAPSVLSPGRLQRGIMNSAQLGLMTDLVSCETVEQIIATAESLCLDLFGASRVAFVPDDHSRMRIALNPSISSDERMKEICLPLSANGKEFGYVHLSHFTFPRYVPTYRPLAEKIADMIAKCLYQLDVFDDYKARMTKAKDEDIQKSTFLARMAHELRTPLHGVMGTLQLLERTDLNDEQKKYMQMSLHSSNILLQTINDILLYSRLEARKLEMNVSSFSIEDLFAELRDLFFSETRRKHIDLVFSISDGFPAPIATDMEKLREVLVNLVGNGIKFTEKGCVDVSAYWDGSVHDNNNIELSFSVKDSGVGIPQENLNDIFKYFYQVDVSNARRANGSGLGLSICKDLVALLGGTIQVTSKLGVGSTFSFDMQANIPF